MSPQSSSSVLQPSLFQEEDVEFLFRTRANYGPGFQLSSWTGESAIFATSGCSVSTIEILPFANVRDAVSNMGYDENDDDDSMSCDWSMESCAVEEEDEEEDEDHDNTIHDNSNKTTSCGQTCPNDNVNQTGSIQLEPEERPRRVHFSECIMIKWYQKADITEHPLLFYSAHELQKIIDGYDLELKQCCNTDRRQVS